MAGCVRIEKRPTGELVAGEVWAAMAWRERLRGLLGKDSLLDGQGLWLVPCWSVHTFGMRFPIDILFMDKANKVLALHENVSFSRIVIGPWHTHSTVELKAGTSEKLAIKKGDILAMMRD